MKKGRYTEEQIAFALQQAEHGTPVAEVCRKLGITEQSFYRWKRKYAGMLPSDMKKLKQLEDENAKLKKLVADLSLDKAMLQDVLSHHGWAAPKTGKACRPERCGGIFVRSIPHQRAPHVRGAEDIPKRLSIQIEEGRTGLFADADTRDRECEGAVWLQAHPCSAVA